MRLIIGVGGVPGSGKTSLMIDFMREEGGGWEEYRSGALKGRMRRDRRVLVLGHYASGLGVFQGTDRLSMGVQPEAERLVRSSTVSDWALIFEGARLFTASFLDVCQRTGALCRWLLLETSAEELSRRRLSRPGSKAGDRFWRSQQTKMSNVMRAIPGVEVRSSNSPSDRESNARRLRELAIGA